MGEVRLESNLPGIQLIEEDNLVEPEQTEIETSPTGKSSVPEKEETHEEITYPPRRSTRAVDHDYRQLNNPLARPTTREVQAPPDIRRRRNHLLRNKRRRSAQKLTSPMPMHVLQELELA